jgi:hypothetical protein
VIAVGLSLSLACASGGGMGDGAASLQALMQRETELPAATRVATSDGALHANVAGRLVGEFAQAADGTYYGEFDIGTRAPVGCHVFGEPKDVATSLVSLSDAIFAEFASTRAIDQRLADVDVGHGGANPYLGLAWVAVSEGVGYHFKLKFGNRADRALYCVHDETGYVKAFDRFFAGFLESLESPAGDPGALFREVSVFRIGESEVGYQVVRVGRDAEGDYRADTHSAMLIQSAPGELSANDELSVEWSHPDGTLINELRVSSDGATQTQLELAPGDGEWTVRGEMNGKPVEERFTAPAALASALAESRRMGAAARGEIGEVRYWRWVGPLSPGAPVEHLLRKTGPSSVRIEAGPIAVDAEVDELGATQGTLRLGRFQVEIERVYVDGSL